MKSYPNLTLDYILYEMSFVNLIMYSSIIPSYESEKEESKSGKQKGMSINEFFSRMKKLKNGEG